MRILLDECVNPRLRIAFPGSTVKTVADMGWRSFTNGRLLREAAGKFDRFVTLDRNLEFQNPAVTLSLGILVLKTRLNDLNTYRPQFAAIRDAASRTKPGQVTILQIGLKAEPFSARRRCSGCQSALSQQSSNRSMRTWIVTIRSLLEKKRARTRWEVLVRARGKKS